MERQTSTGHYRSASITIHANCGRATKPGQSHFIRAGRAHLRQALYMPALVAIRFDADMRAKYQALVAAGKPPKVAITAIMRKLAILANTLLRQQRTWTPKAA